MINDLIQKALSYAGLQLVYLKDQVIDQDELFLEIYELCKPYTMTSRERMYALYKSVLYIIDNEIPGALVECGVWKGGSCMLMAYLLKRFGVVRDIMLFDTFAGMSEPGTEDISIRKSRNARSIWKRNQQEDSNTWCLSPIKEVQSNMHLTGYSDRHMHFIKGDILHSIPRSAPNSIALLRLDTDWYASTRHELIHLYPRLSSGGVLVVDDYGYWGGAKKAVDEYFSIKSPLLLRVDEPGRVAVKIR